MASSLLDRAREVMKKNVAGGLLVLPVASAAAGTFTFENSGVYYSNSGGLVSSYSVAGSTAGGSALDGGSALKLWGTTPTLGYPTFPYYHHWAPPYEDYYTIYNEVAMRWSGNFQGVFQPYQWVGYDEESQTDVYAGDRWEFKYDFYIHTTGDLSPYVTLQAQMSGDQWASQGIYLQSQTEEGGVIHYSGTASVDFNSLPYEVKDTYLSEWTITLIVYGGGLSEGQSFWVDIPQNSIDHGFNAVPEAASLGLLAMPAILLMNKRKKANR